MSENKIDVLDVFSDVQYRAFNARWPDAVIKEIDKARADVAELIEAAKIVEVCYRNRRLSAAIARCCGGGK